jgi:adenosylhomocysteinase
MQNNSQPFSVDFKAELEWAATNMQRLKQSIAALPDLRGARIAFCTHLDIKMVPAFEGLISRGADLFFTTCNPHTVRDKVVQYLSRQAQVDAWQGMDHDSWQKSLLKALDWAPTHLVELGADLTSILHEKPLSASSVCAGIEGTSSGISRLTGLTLRYPVFNLNNVPAKEQLHNRRMVGISTWHTFFERTHLTLHEKQVAVIGFGSVGQGLADSARAYGGNVCIVENNRERALEAAFAGWNVLPLAAALQAADVVVTATGVPAVLGRAQFALLKPGAFLLNVGHRNDEIDLVVLRSRPHRSVLPFIEEFDLDGRIIYLFAGGSMANLVAGYGDSLNAFDLTLALMIETIGYVVKSAGSYEPGIHPLPDSLWKSVL